jgi:hypothetical protein
MLLYWVVKMRLILVILLFVSTVLFADQIFNGKVTAQSGLVLRSEDSTSSEKLALIPTDTILSLSQSDFPKCETIEKTFGCWLETSYDKKNGWVFTGFLDLNYNNVQETSTGVFDYAVLGDDGYSYIAIKVNGKENRFVKRGSIKGVQFDALTPFNAGENMENKLKSPFYGKNLTITWKKHTSFHEPAGSFETVNLIVGIEEK